MSTIEQQKLTVQQVVAEAEKRRDAFIVNRSKIQEEVDRYGEGLANVDPKLLEGIIEPEKFRCKLLLPSLFAEKFDYSQYEKERAEFDAIVCKIDTVVDSLMEEATVIIRG